MPSAMVLVPQSPQISQVLPWARKGMQQRSIRIVIVLSLFTATYFLFGMDRPGGFPPRMAPSFFLADLMVKGRQQPFPIKDLTPGKVPLGLGLALGPEGGQKGAHGTGEVL